MGPRTFIVKEYTKPSPARSRPFELSKDRCRSTGWIAVHGRSRPAWGRVFFRSRRVVVVPAGRFLSREVSESQGVGLKRAIRAGNQSWIEFGHLWFRVFRKFADDVCHMPAMLRETTH